MTKPDDPTNISFKPLGENANTGLTKREYFAAMALQGLIATNRHEFKQAVEVSVIFADELIEQLNEGKTK